MQITTRSIAVALMRLTAVSVLLVAGTRLIPGCSNSPADSTGKTTNIPPGGGSCTHPAPGCDCTAAGETAPCGNVELKSGESVVCSEGKTTCDGTKWGTCEGTITVTTGSISGGSLRLQSLGGSSMCGSGGVPADPCDPYCNGFPGSGGGFDASPLTAGEGGLTIPTGPGACMCNEPAQPAQLASAITVSGLPAACTGANDAGMGTDNCNEDYQCVNGTCTPYPAAGVNKACTALPDYTLGLGCNNGSDWQLTVCNRGYVPSPGLGTLYVAIGDGTPNGTPGACPWPNGPAITNAADHENGECAINLMTTSIGPGQCINVDVASQCTQLDGVTPLTTLNAQHHWAMVNPPTSILAASTPVPECDSCNNYTGLEKSEIGPNSTCVNTNCGTTCGGGSDAGVDGGMGCHTYLTGTVYDPGTNIPLPGLDVYEPTSIAALPVFVDGPACDTCTSVLPPAANIVSSTGSAVDGTFALEVNTTTAIPIVFQTGRWRRAITIAGPITACAQTNITVPADCTWPGTNCLTRLPQTHAEGDIPLTAVITGGLEPFECSIAQFMGPATAPEFGIGGASRMQLFQDTGANQLGATSLPMSTSVYPLLAVPGSKYNQVIAGCGGDGSNYANMGGVAQGQVYGFLEAGGKSFINHRSAKAIVLPPGSSGSALPAWSATSTWGSTAGFGNLGNNLTGLVDPGGTTVRTGTTAAVNVPATKNGKYWITEPPGLQGNSANVTTVILSSTTKTGTNWKGTFAAPNLTLTNNTGLAAAYDLGFVALWNSTAGANNGIWPIPAGGYTSATNVKVTNAAGVAQAVAAGNWAAAEPAGGLGAAFATYLGGTLTLAGANTPGNNGAFVIQSVPTAQKVTITNAAAAYDSNNGKNAATWVATQPGIYNISGLTGMSATDVGNTITFTGANSGVNNGTFPIVSVVSPTEITITNPGVPVTDANNGSISWTETSPNIGNPGQAQFRQWLTAQNAYAGGGGCASMTGVCTPVPAWQEALNPSPTLAFEWLRGASTNGNNDDWGGFPSGNYSLIYSFDTNSTGPVATLSADGGPGAGCGRTIMSDMHVNANRGNSAGSFPGECNFGGGLTPNEMAFEYLFFELSACNVGGPPIKNSAPPPPPPPAMLMPTTIDLTYQATCPAGTGPVWGFFQWQATIPMGTNIQFNAQTAPANGAMPGTYGPSVPIGTAAATTSGWTQDPCAVQGHLQDLAVYGNNAACTGSTPASAQTSQEYLQVAVTFNPAGTFAPVLTQWDQLYDCVPNQ